MENPTGESVDGPLRLDFDRRLTLQFRGSVVTSDAGLLAYRELDDALGLSVMAGGALADARTGKNGRHALVGLLRQSVFGRLAGYEDVNDAETSAPSAIWNAAPFVLATCIAPTAGRTCLTRSWRAKSEQGLAPLFPRRCRLCQPLGLQVRDPAACQQRAPGKHRLLAQAPRWPSSYRGPAVSHQLQLPGAELTMPLGGRRPCTRSIH
jgi:hypothetical protein